MVSKLVLMVVSHVSAYTLPSKQMIRTELIRDSWHNDAYAGNGDRDTGTDCATSRFYSVKRDTTDPSYFHLHYNYEMQADGATCQNETFSVSATVQQMRAFSIDGWGVLPESWRRMV